MHARHPVAATYFFFCFFFGGVGQTAFAKSTITQCLIIVHTSFWSRSMHIELLSPMMYHTCTIDHATWHYLLELSFFGVSTVLSVYHSKFCSSIQNLFMVLEFWRLCEYKLDSDYLKGADNSREYCLFNQNSYLVFFYTTWFSKSNHCRTDHHYLALILLGLVVCNLYCDTPPLRIGESGVCLSSQWIQNIPGALMLTSNGSGEVKYH